jgi:hypothetical protein
MMSDWGSALPDQEVEYTIILRNDYPAAAGAAGNLNEVVITSTFPRNLEMQGAATDRGKDPRLVGNDLQYTLDTLQPGEAVEITVRTSVKPDVERGTRLVAQAQLDYEHLSLPVLSNIVTLLVLDETRRPAVQLTTPFPQFGVSAQITPTLTSTPAVPTETPAPTSTPEPLIIVTLTATPTPARTAVPTETPAPAGTSAPAGTPTPTETPAQVAGVVGMPTPSPFVPQVPRRNTVRTQEPEGTLVPLPATSTGVPLAGFVLLGLTLMIRTVRLHRAREQI